MKLVFVKADVVKAIAKLANVTEQSVVLYDGVPETVGECDAVPSIPTTGRPRGKRKPQQPETLKVAE
jgi:hypothetical protein